MQTYTGRIEAGRFYPVNGTKVPDCKVAVLVIESNPQNDISHHQAEAMRRFREEIRDSDEPVPEFERIKLQEIEI